MLKQAILKAAGPVLVPESLPPLVQAESPKRPPTAPVETADLVAHLTQFINDRLQAGTTDLHAELFALVERQLVLQVLHHTGGNQSHTARILGLTRKTVRAKLNSVGISVEQSRSVAESRAS